jgi:hypothetical protein
MKCILHSTIVKCNMKVSLYHNIIFYIIFYVNICQFSLWLKRNVQLHFAQNVHKLHLLISFEEISCTMVYIWQNLSDIIILNWHIQFLCASFVSTCNLTCSLGGISVKLYILTFQQSFVKYRCN